MKYYQLKSKFIPSIARFSLWSIRIKWSH